MPDLEDKLSAILGDQNAMSQIMALAQSLSATEEQDGEKNCGAVSETTELLPSQGQDVQLLNALRPYLKHSRRKKLDRTLELLQLLRLLKGSRD